MRNRGLGASIRQRLLDLARAEERPFQEILQYFAMERFLYRLANSSYADQFILKGALLMTIRKYKSVTEMPGVQPLRPLDPENIRVACELSELAFGLGGWQFEPGVYKFRSLEEASADWRQREKENVRTKGSRDPAARHE